MRNGHHEDPFRLRAVQEPVREARNQHTPQPATEWMATLRELDEALIRALNRCEKVGAEVLRVLLVELRRRDQLRARFGMELDSSQRSDERAFSTT
jgi:hypothetical protein